MGEDLLAEEALKQHQLLNVGGIRQKWKEHLSGRRNWQYLLCERTCVSGLYRHAQSTDLALNDQMRG